MGTGDRPAKDLRDVRGSAMAVRCARVRPAQQVDRDAAHSVTDRRARGLREAAGLLARVATAGEGRVARRAPVDRDRDRAGALVRLGLAVVVARPSRAWATGRGDRGKSSALRLWNAKGVGEFGRASKKRGGAG
ncbi:MAG: hypothetical protein NTZ05_19560 [Chloroflexi bacterium]|nr:hypothetical protein [Chloroflexota bacterium]